MDQSIQERHKMIDGYKVFASFEERKHSGEIDYGVWWHMRYSPRGPFYKVSFIFDTGEVYAVNLNDMDHYNVLAWTLNVGDSKETRQEIEELMDGWLDMENDLDALIEKIG
jgi:hypothetical protein